MARVTSAAVFRRLVAIAVAWLATLGVAWGIVGLPERCPEVTPRQARAAATATVDWFARNQLPDGRWVYRYNIETDEVDTRPHTVRHSGVTMALYQADQVGIEGALAVADAGADWSLRQLDRVDDMAMVAPGRYAPSGGTALLVAGLATRRLATEDPVYDDDLYAMGRFLIAMTEPSGAVLQEWDTETDRAVPGLYSVFFTGETYFALSLLAQLDPAGLHGDWSGTAERIGRYVATERDEAEERFPPVPDHWAAYGLAASVDPDDLDLPPEESRYAERLAQLFGIEVRYESQRTGSTLNRWVLRGPQALGAGLGTLGEGLGSLWQLSGDGGPLEEHRATIGERLRCAAGMLASRQTDSDAADEAGHPELAEGAWFRLGWTQMDDQQHALSALLLAEPALAASEHEPTSSGKADVAQVLWIMLIAVAFVNPTRLRALVRDRRPATGRAVLACVLTFVPLAAVALVAEPVVDAIEVSPPTALIAAGLVLGLAAIVDLVWPRATADGGPGQSSWDDLPSWLAPYVPLVIPGLLRPAGLILVLAVAADSGVPAGLAVAAVTAGSGLAVLLPGRGGPITAAAGGWTWRAFATLAVCGGVTLIAEGVFSI